MNDMDEMSSAGSTSSTTAPDNHSPPGLPGNFGHLDARTGTQRSQQTMAIHGQHHPPGDVPEPGRQVRTMPNFIFRLVPIEYLPTTQAPRAY